MSFLKKAQEAAEAGHAVTVAEAAGTDALPPSSVARG
jgi:hypothetical protein